MLHQFLILVTSTRHLSKSQRVSDQLEPVSLVCGTADATLMKQVFDVPQQERKSEIPRYTELDDLRRSSE